MSNEELVSSISERAGVSTQTVGEILQAIGEVWSEEILSSGELEVEHIGMFLLDHRPGRRAITAASKEIIVLPPTDFVSFLPAPELVDWSNRVL